MRRTGRVTAGTLCLRTTNSRGIGDVTVTPFGRPSWNPVGGRLGLG